MKTRFLFPNHFKTVGWVLFVPSLVLIVSSALFNVSPDDFLTIDVFAIYHESIGKDLDFFKSLPIVFQMNY